MRKVRTAAGVLALSLLAASGCGDSTTPPTAAERPTYDSGGTVGSGNRADSTITRTGAAAPDSTASK